jgi:Uncharacterized protein conserved in bacteria (DUF2188)
MLSLLRVANGKSRKKAVKKASAMTENETDAVSTAKDFAKNSGTKSQVKIHKQDGTIQTE